MVGYTIPSVPGGYTFCKRDVPRKAPLLLPYEVSGDFGNAFPALPRAVGPEKQPKRLQERKTCGISRVSSLLHLRRTHVQDIRYWPGGGTMKRTPTPTLTSTLKERKKPYLLDVMRKRERRADSGVASPFLPPFTQESTVRSR